MALNRIKPNQTKPSILHFFFFATVSSIMYYNRKTWMFLLILIYTILFDIFVYVYICCANILLLLICFVAVIDFRCIGIIINYAIFIYICYRIHKKLKIEQQCSRLYCYSRLQKYDTCTSIKSGGVRLALWAQTFMLYNLYSNSDVYIVILTC